MPAEKQKLIRVMYAPTGKMFHGRELVREGSGGTFVATEKQAIEKARRVIDKWHNTNITVPEVRDPGTNAIIRKEKRVRQDVVVIWFDELEQEWDSVKEKWGIPVLTKNNKPKDLTYVPPPELELEEYEVEDEEQDALAGVV